MTGALQQGLLSRAALRSLVFARGETESRQGKSPAQAGREGWVRVRSEGDRTGKKSLPRRLLPTRGARHGDTLTTKLQSSGLCE